MEAFINLVEAQYDKHIPMVLADMLITMASEIIMNIDATVEYLFESIL